MRIPIIVEAAENFTPPPIGISIISWILYGLWGGYTFFIGIGVPLTTDLASVGDAVMKLAITDMDGHKISKLRIVARQVVCCVIPFVMIYTGSILFSLSVIILFSTMFLKNKRHKTYVHLVDYIFGTSVYSIEFERQEKPTAFECKNITPALPWKRVTSSLIDILIVLPMAFIFVTIFDLHNYAALLDVPINSWILYVWWGIYVLCFSVGAPLMTDSVSIGDTLIKLRITDLKGNKINKWKLVARQLLCFIVMLGITPVLK